MKTKFFIGMLALVLGVIGIVIVLASENALVVHPKGIIAQDELELIIANIMSDAGNHYTHLHSCYSL